MRTCFVIILSIGYLSLYSQQDFYAKEDSLFGTLDTIVMEDLSFSTCDFIIKESLTPIMLEDAETCFGKADHIKDDISYLYDTRLKIAEFGKNKFIFYQKIKSKEVYGCKEFILQDESIKLSYPRINIGCDINIIKECFPKSYSASKNNEKDYDVNILVLSNTANALLDFYFVVSISNDKVSKIWFKYF